MAAPEDRNRSLKQALVESLTAILSPDQQVRQMAEEQLKVLEVTEGKNFFLNYCSTKHFTQFVTTFAGNETSEVSRFHKINTMYPDFSASAAFLGIMQQFFGDDDLFALLISALNPLARCFVYFLYMYLIVKTFKQLELAITTVRVHVCITSSMSCRLLSYCFLY